MNQPTTPVFPASLIPFDQMQYHATSEKLVQILINRTRNDNPLFFRVIAGYYFCKVAAQMRVTIATKDNGDLPVNMYALNLSPSGTGKGVSTGILDNQVTALFKKRFMEETFPELAKRELPLIANRRIMKMKSATPVDPEQMLEKVTADFENLGELAFDFSEATSAAVKQMRDKLLWAKAGAVNLEMDEIGSTLLGQQEVLTAFLELYDQGRIKKKLIKNTADQRRTEDVEGKTPTNLLMFGEPTKLLDGSTTEEQFYKMLMTGYARRCFFGYSRNATKMKGKTAREIFEMKTRQDTSQFMEQLADHLESLADIVNHGRKLVVSEDTSIKVIDYQLYCEDRADALKDHQEIQKAEMTHRYWKALKLAGAYAFIDDSPELTAEHFYSAVKLAEESGEAFAQLLSRDRPWVKLAKYLATMGAEMTHADMAEDLPYYPTAESKRRDIMQLAAAWGVKNNIVIKKSVENQIEFFKGESLEVTNLAQLKVAWSTQFTTGYRNELAPWDQLHVMTQQPGFHWVNHHLQGGYDDPAQGYRDDDHCLAGFNLLVLDVDGALQLEAAKGLLEGQKALYYTTKSSTPAQNRFRIILPMKYVLVMDGREYTEFYKNVEAALPFKVDPSCSQRSKKWMAHAGHFEYTEGELFDPLPFIPRTSKAEEMQKKLLEHRNVDQLERWILNHIADGNRNNMLLRYAMILVDAGLSLVTIQQKVTELNDKIANKLTAQELQGSIMVTVGKRLQARGQVAAAQSAATATAQGAPQLNVLASLGSQLTP